MHVVESFPREGMYWMPLPGISERRLLLRTVAVVATGAVLRIYQLLLEVAAGGLVPADRLVSLGEPKRCRDVNEVPRPTGNTRGDTRSEIWCVNGKLEDGCLGGCQAEEEEGPGPSLEKLNVPKSSTRSSNSRRPPPPP